MLRALPSSHHETEHASVHPDFRSEGMLEKRATLCRHCAARLLSVVLQDAAQSNFKSREYSCGHERYCLVQETIQPTLCSPIASASVAPTSVGMFMKTFWLFCVPSCRREGLLMPWLISRSEASNVILVINDAQGTALHRHATGIF